MHELLGVLGYEHVVYGADSLIFLANFLLKQVKLIACVCNFGVKIRNKNIKYFDVYHKRTKSRITKLQIKGNKKFKWGLRNWNIVIKTNFRGREAQEEGGL